MTTQPAVCEIDGCGVLAIGRCDVCKKAFCQSHQARSLILPYASLCSLCLAQSEASKKQRKSAIQADKDYIAAKASDELRKSRVSTIDIYELKQEFRSGLFGRVQHIDKFNFVCEGWILGEFTWSIDISHTEGQGPDTKDWRETNSSSRLTALLNSGQVVPVDEMADNNGYFVTENILKYNHATLVDSWKSVVKAVGELISKSS